MLFQIVLIQYVKNTMTFKIAGFRIGDEYGNEANRLIYIAASSLQPLPAINKSLGNVKA